MLPQLSPILELCPANLWLPELLQSTGSELQSGRRQQAAVGNVRQHETMVAKNPNLPVSPGVFIFTPCCHEEEGKKERKTPQLRLRSRGRISPSCSCEDQPVCRPVPRPLVPELENCGENHGKLSAAAPSSSAVLCGGAAASARCASPAQQQQNGLFSDELRGTQRRDWSSGPGTVSGQRWSLLKLRRKTANRPDTKRNVASLPL